MLPVAIDREVRILVRPTGGTNVRLRSEALDEDGEFELDNLVPSQQHPWLNYAIGLVRMLRETEHALPGMDILMSSDLPIAAGLSSSAALEMALLAVFQRVAGFRLPAMQEILLAQRAEWEFVGVRCGVMDQAACRLATKGHALLLDCRDLTYRQVPINVDAEIVVCHSGVSRALADSVYNRRREECEIAVDALRRREPSIQSLRDVTAAEWVRLAHVVPEPARYRAQHVVTENARVRAAVEALEEGRLDRLAVLFAASHESLRADYEVSSPELDILVEIARTTSPRIASRLNGAGFGGCTVNLVPPGCVDAFERRVLEEYPRRTGRSPAVLRLQTASGAESSGGTTL